jgi:hypothetical protein
MSPEVHAALETALALAEMAASIALPGSGPLIALAVKAADAIITAVESSGDVMTVADRAAWIARAEAVVLATA